MKRLSSTICVPFLLLLLIVALVSSAPSPVPVATATSPIQTERAFFGNLHSHTSFSDGSGTP